MPMHMQMLEPPCMHSDVALHACPSMCIVQYIIYACTMKPTNKIVLFETRSICKLLDRYTCACAHVYILYNVAATKYC